MMVFWMDWAAKDIIMHFWGRQDRQLLVIESSRLHNYPF